MRRIAIVVFPQVQALDVAGPLDVFAETNAFVSRDEGYEVTLIGTAPGPFRASNGMLMSPDRLIADAGDGYDMILVAGGPGLPTSERDPALSDWLVDAVRHVRQYGSICTGAFVLGHAGLLDDRQVTTHWQDAPALADRFPKARVAFDRIYLRDGALVTSAGVTAGIDLALSLVAEDHGARTALAVAKRLVVVAQRQGGQSQFSPFLTALADEDSPVAKVQAHVMAHLADDFTVEKLATLAGMSVRNFSRVFAEEARLTPAEFVEGARLDAARNLLEASELALKQVAHRSGFGSVARMRAVFEKRLGVTPVQYRASFLRVD
jgi:transcriptional regulator GlxA family with amidase domain